MISSRDEVRRRSSELSSRCACCFPRCDCDEDRRSEAKGQESEGRSGNDEARMVRAGLALNDEGMTQAGNDDLMLVLVLVLVLVITIGRRSEDGRQRANMTTRLRTTGRRDKALRGRQSGRTT